MAFQYSESSFLLTGYGSAGASSHPQHGTPTIQLFTAPAVDVETGITYRVELAEGNELLPPRVPVTRRAPESVARPDGWTETPHAKGAAPDYDTVFPENEVKRLDLTISPSGWQAMLDDMTGLYGESGSGGSSKPNNGAEPPMGPG